MESGKGELVCTSSFPSQPVFFWSDDEKKIYKETYFNIYPNVWRHGDYAEITENKNNTGEIPNLCIRITSIEKSAITLGIRGNNASRLRVL